MPRHPEHDFKLSVAMAQLDIDAGHPQKNVARAKTLIDQSRDAGADLVVFPEMISGYMVSDLLEDSAYVQDCMAASLELREYTQGINVIWGDVVGDFRWGDPQAETNRYNPLARGNDGRFLRYNAAHVATNGQPAPTSQPLPTFDGHSVYPLRGMTVKTNEPLYHQFEDQRHMLPLKELSQRLGIPIEKFLQPFVMDVRGQTLKVGVLICEDIWVGDYFYNGKPLIPGAILRDNQADILIAISSSPSWAEKNPRRIKNSNQFMTELLRSGNGQTLPFISVNHVGTQDNGKNIYIFDGRSRALSADGRQQIQAAAMEEGVSVVGVQVETSSSFSPSSELPMTKAEIRHEQLAHLEYGLKSFCEKRGIRQVVIGLSGGIDSALVSYLCVKVLGKDNVLTVNMPTRFNDPLTKDAAKAIAESLGTEYVVVPIEDLANNVRQLVKEVTWHDDGGVYSPETLRPEVDQQTADDARLVDENIQARIRAADILSGLASKYKAVYTNNGNKSEALQGFLTLDGDGRGFLQIIADLFKIDIINLCVDINLQAAADHQPAPIPWGLIQPLFDPEYYYDNWDGQQTPIPEGITPIVASAELSEAQAVAEGKGDPIHFIYHDRVLRKWAEDRYNIQDIAEALVSGGLPELKRFLDLTDLAMERTFGTYLATPADFIADLERRWRNYHQATIYKQIQSPPVISISKRPEGYDHRRSQISADFPRAYTALKKCILERNNWDMWK